MVIDGDWLTYFFIKDTSLRVPAQVPVVSATNLIQNLRF